MGDLPEGFRNGALWLARFVQLRLPRRLDDEGLCISLTGISLAQQGLNLDKSLEEIPETAEALATQLNERHSQSSENFQISFQRRPIMWLMSAAFLSPDTSQLVGFREMVGRSWAALKTNGILESNAQLRVVGDCLAGMLDGQYVDQHPPLMEYSSPYIASTEIIRSIVTYLAVASMHGRQIPNLSDTERRYLLSALPFWTFFYIKEGDLDMVCPLIRGLRYLGLTDIAEFRQGVCFILKQACEDGSFGTAGMTTMFLGSAYANGTIDVERSVKLPTTVASLWALLEASRTGSVPESKSAVCSSRT